MTEKGFMTVGNSDGTNKKKKQKPEVPAYVEMPQSLL